MGRAFTVLGMGIAGVVTVVVFVWTRGRAYSRIFRTEKPPPPGAEPDADPLPTGIEVRIRYEKNVDLID